MYDKIEKMLMRYKNSHLLYYILILLAKKTKPKSEKIPDQ